MKSSFTRFFVFALFACFGMKSFAETHIISHTEVAFSPINFNCIVGDVIRWEWSSGFHNTTSATVPQGAATWDSDLSQALPVFEYTVEVPGTYGYFCPFHISVGMAGAFIASLPVSVKPTLNTTPRDMVVGLEMGSKTLHITLDGGEVANGAIKIYDLTGKIVAVVYEGNLEEKRITYDASELGRGIYFVRLEEGSKVITRKIMLN